MSDQDEFDGDGCVVLPKNYLNLAIRVFSANAAVAQRVGTPLAFLQKPHNLGRCGIERRHDPVEEIDLPRRDA